MEKINITFASSLQDVYNDIVFLQNNNEILIEENILKSLKNETSYTYLVASVESKSPVAFMILKNAIDVVELEYILVDKNFRERKIGTLLITSLEKSIKDTSSSLHGITKIMLEVRKSNKSAISFYEQNGFEKIHERKKYYTNPQDDAFIYEKYLK